MPYLARWTISFYENVIAQQGFQGISTRENIPDKIVAMRLNMNTINRS